MSITDELRDWAHGFTEPYKRNEQQLLAIANRIEAEALSRRNAAYNMGYKAGIDVGFASADDWLADHEDAMAEHGWVKLPVDADGEYIHIGDRMENNERVSRIVLTDDDWQPSVYLEKIPNVLHEYFCNEISHYHPDTWERIIEDALDGYHDTDFEKLVARCKKLAGDAE